MMQATTALLGQTIQQFAARENLDASSVTLIDDNAPGHVARTVALTPSQALANPGASGRLAGIGPVQPAASRWDNAITSNNDAVSMPRLPQRRNSLD